MAKKTKEEREKEYLDAVEKVFTHPLMPWQKELLLEIRRATMEGRTPVVELPRSRGFGR